MGSAQSKPSASISHKMKATKPMTLRRLGVGLLFPRSRATKRVVRHASQFGPPGPNITPADQDAPEEGETKDKPRVGSTFYKMFESAATTFASLAVLGVAGYGYHLYYKSLVLRKMDKAFDPGDPVLDMAQPTFSSNVQPGPDDDAQNTGDRWIRRPEQDRMDAIVNGKKQGRYYLIIGEKGTGKSSMILEAMRTRNGECVSMFDAHADPEIFRIRLGKALNYEFHEDYIGSLFSVRGPRDTTALLDIERAFNKLEKIALQRRGKKKNPLVLIINSAHLIRDDENGRDLLELMQQRAEAWAASNLITMVFNSDDYWVYERLKRYATRMEIFMVRDLPKDRAIAALDQYRRKYFPNQQRDSSILAQVYDKVGGRLSYLNGVAKSSHMLQKCDAINQAEKTWFLNQCGVLGEAMDDDVMDQQKYASAAMVLAKALVEKEKEEGSWDAETGHMLPEVPLHVARQIMTRADFIQQYDHDNLFTIDSNAMVRADSVPMMNAFREVCNQEGFDEYLEATLDRISAIESLNRTKEITLKDLWIEQKNELRGKYEARTMDTKGRETGRTQFSYIPPEEGSDDTGSS